MIRRELPLNKVASPAGPIAQGLPQRLRESAITLIAAILQIALAVPLLGREDAVGRRDMST
jgi:hypothetical protein